MKLVIFLPTKELVFHQATFVVEDYETLTFEYISATDNTSRKGCFFTSQIAGYSKDL